MTIQLQNIKKNPLLTERGQGYTRMYEKILSLPRPTRVHPASGIRFCRVFSF